MLPTVWGMLWGRMARTFLTGSTMPGSAPYLLMPCEGLALRSALRPRTVRSLYITVPLMGLLVRLRTWLNVWKRPMALAVLLSCTLLLVPLGSSVLALNSRVARLGDSADFLTRPSPQVNMSRAPRQRLREIPRLCLVCS